MGKIVIPECYRPVQLTAAERTCVYTSTETKRILGFGHESMPIAFGEAFTREVLYHTIDIERWAEKYRKQEREDAEMKDYRRTMREKPARDAIRAALVARRAHVDGPNRAYIDANLRLMDQREQRALKRQQESFLLSEKYDMSATQEDISLDAPVFRALSGKK